MALGRYDRKGVFGARRQATSSEHERGSPDDEGGNKVAQCNHEIGRWFQPLRNNKGLFWKSKRGGGSRPYTKSREERVQANQEFQRGVGRVPFPVAPSGFSSVGQRDLARIGLSHFYV